MGIHVKESLVREYEKMLFRDVRIPLNPQFMAPIRFVRQVTVGSLLTALLITGSVAMPMNTSAKSFENQASKSISLTFKHGEILVKFKPSVSDAAADSFAKKKRLKKKQKFKRERISLFQTEAGKSTEQMIQEFSQDPHVEYVEPNYIRTVQATPNDPHMKNLWGLKAMNAPAAWDKTTGNPSVTVAVLDTGALYQHADLAASMWDGSTNAGGCKDQYNVVIPGGCPHHGWDFVNDDNNPLDDHGHGSHVASTLGATGNNNTGIAGVNWKVKIMAMKIAGANGSLTSSDWIRGLYFAKNNGVNIVNMSFAGDLPSKAERDAIQNFPGLVVVASGNGGADAIGDNIDGDPSYPASYRLPNMISVAATASGDALGKFSNYGPQSVDIAAPGVNILGASSIQNGTSYYQYMSGTSMAAPHVTGLAALIWGYKPSLTMAEVRTAILESGDPIALLKGKTVTGRRINASNALAYVDEHYTPAVQPPIPTIPPVVVIGDGMTDVPYYSPAPPVPSTTQPYPNGTLLKLVNRGFYYFIINGKRKLIPYPTYRKYYYKKYPIVIVTQRDLLKVPIYRGK